MKIPAEMQEVLGAVLEQSLMPVAVFGDGGELVYGNAAFKALFSLRYENLADSPGLKSFQRHAAEVVTKDVVKHAHRTESHMLGFPERPFNVHFSRITVASTGMRYVVATLEDRSSEVDRAERILRAQRRFQDFARCSSDWMWEVDRQGRITYLSDQFTQVMGVPGELFLGQSFFQIGTFRARGNGRPFAQQRAFRDWMFDLTRRSGEKRLQRVSGMPIYDDDGKFIGFRGTGTDITEQNAVQQALRTSRDQLDDTVRALSEKSVDLLLALEAAEAANRTQAEFLANVSHELRTPLNAIIGFSEILCTNMFGPLGHEKYQGYATDIHTSARHLYDLISDVLDLSKAELGNGNLQFAEVAVDDEIAYCMRVIEAKAGSKKQTVSYSAAEPGLLAHADRRAFRQIVTNLLSNAVKFTPETGRVDIRVRRLSDDRIEIAVSDTGIGILPEDIPKITRPFIRGSHSPALQQEGTGLGLAVTKSLAELHGGGLHIDSTPNEGTTVTVALPAVRQPVSMPALL